MKKHKKSYLSKFPKSGVPELTEIELKKLISDLTGVTSGVSVLIFKHSCKVEIPIKSLSDLHNEKLRLSLNQTVSGVRIKNQNKHFVFTGEHTYQIDSCLQEVLVFNKK